MSGISTRSRWFLGMAMGGAIGSALALSTNCASAQIRPDGTLPNNSTVRLEGNNHIIEGGTRAGGNLFHSFSEFSVPNKETAHFNNAADVQNIFGRVTGGSVSKIDGIIKAMGTANLFLINPNGIIFGKNASLNVGGSFVGTTANAIQFGNLGFFSATNPDASAPMLTINPSALFFNQSTIAAISNSSVAKAGLDPTRAEVTGLRVPDGQSLLLVGGDVNINGGSLRAYGGRVELAGLAAPGTVGLNVGQNILTLSLTEDVQRANVSLSNGAEVNVRAQDSGSIAINAQNVSLTGGSKLRAGIESELGTPQSKAGDIDINATGDTVLSDGSFIANTVVPNAVGQGGNVSISADSLSVTNGAQLNASTLGQGNAGNVIINAAKSVSLDGSGSTIFSNVGAVNNTQNNIVKGNGGNTQITTDQLFLSNGAQLVASTLGQGNAGNVIVNASKSVSLDGKSGIFSSVGAINNTQNNIVNGNGGNIQITTDQLFLSNGAQLQAITFGQGNAGNVIINAAKSVSLDGSGSIIFSTVGAINNTQNNIVNGNGGNIQITTDQLFLSNGAQLQAITFGQGDAGNIEINAKNSVSVKGTDSSSGSSSGLFTSTDFNSTGNGGDLTVNTPLFHVSDGAVLDARTANNRNGGNITLNVGQAEILNGGQLVAISSGAGNAGKITVNATNQVIVDGSDRTRNDRVAKFGTAVDSIDASSGIFVLSQSTGSAGDIIVTSPRVTLDNSGILNAQSESLNGGNINLQSDLLIMRRGALISTTAGTANAGGNGGNITIDVPNGFIIAPPKENSNITANAFKGSGGKVQINATGIYGLTVLSREDLVRLLGTSDLTQEMDFQKLPSSITAISQTNPNLNGQVNLNTPDADPSRGLTQLPINLVDASSQIDNSCNPKSKQRASSFTITGRGGLPPNPRTEPLSSDAVQVDWVSLKPSRDNHKSVTLRQKPTPIRTPIVQATGWTRNSFM